MESHYCIVSIAIAVVVTIVVISLLILVRDIARFANKRIRGESRTSRLPEAGRPAEREEESR
ncbi:hypothetical protein K8I61_09965 [bacterium]|nr:hypothetical protein [bacterium]